MFPRCNLLDYRMILFIYRKPHDRQELLTRSLSISTADFQQSLINPFALLVLKPQTHSS